MSSDRKPQPDNKKQSANIKHRCEKSLPGLFKKEKKDDPKGDNKL